MGPQMVVEKATSCWSRWDQVGYITDPVLHHPLLTIVQRQTKRRSMETSHIYYDDTTPLVIGSHFQ